MNWVDVFVIAGLIVSGMIGWLRGFLREALGLAAWVVAAWLALSFFQQLTPSLLGLIKNPDIAAAAAFGAIFIVVLIVASVLAGVLSRVIRTTPLVMLDGTLGFAFGLLRGGALLVAAYIAAGILLPFNQWPEVVQQSRLLPYVYQASGAVVDLVPSHYRPVVVVPKVAPPPPITGLLQATPTGSALAPPPPARPPGQAWQDLQNRATHGR